MTNRLSVFEESILSDTVTDVIYFHAHADDEAFLTAGTMLQCVERGKRVSVVYFAPRDRHVSRSKIRKEEASASCALLGVDKIFFLPFRSKSYTGGRSDTFLKNTSDVISKSFWKSITSIGIDPSRTVIVGYDSTGGYGNPDHIHLSNVTQKILRDSPQEFYQYLEVIFPWSLVNSLLENLKPGEPRPFTRDWVTPSNIPVATIVHQLTQKQLVLKKQALQKYTSQISAKDFPLALGSESFGYLFGQEFYQLSPCIGRPSTRSKSGQPG